MSNYKEAFEQERKKFQAETLRATQLSKALNDITRVFIGERHDGKKPDCPRCKLVQQALEALKNTNYYDELKDEINHN